MPSAVAKEMEQIVVMTGFIERFLERLEGVETRIGTLESEFGAAGLRAGGVGQPHLPLTLDAEPPPRMET